MLVKYLVPVLAYLCFVQGQSQCTTPDGETGVCTKIDECEPLLKRVNESATLQSESLNRLQKSICGFEASVAKVCCPYCLTLENKEVTGKCVNVFDCDHIKKGLTTPPVTQQYMNYVKSLRCKGRLNVCCGPPVNPELLPSTLTPGTLTSYNAGCTLNAELPDPTSGCFGRHESNKTITGRSKADIKGFPWLALIEYHKDDRIMLLCGGALISGRYVVTAAHCVHGKILKVGTPKNVRLGEYNTTNDGKDCVEGENGYLECNLGPVVIPIEQTIPFPIYFLIQKENDIALLRLASIASYTDFVRPICLPTVDITANFPENGMLFVAGWGARNETSKVKHHTDLPYKTNEDCQQAYNNALPAREIKIWNDQVCAGGVIGKNPCISSAGGPLMYYDETHFELFGISNFGPNPCESEIPSVYTKVFKFLTWIQSNIKT